MGYTVLKNSGLQKMYDDNSLEYHALKFVRESCEELRFNHSKDNELEYTGKSIKPNQIPYNMEKDIDRLCLERSIERFLNSGKKEDAFDVYFCYLEMFVGDYKKTRRMIELLSEFEANGSGLLMKHRDHYSHSVYVFALGLAIYESNDIYRNTYNKYYGLNDCKKAACHYLKYWGLTSLFHDIGYPFELPFEQVCSYFEVNGDKRENRPFLTYQGLESFINLGDKEKSMLQNIMCIDNINTTDELFAHALTEKLKDSYNVDEKQMLLYLKNKPSHPDMFGHYMDHAYFSATILFKKLFGELELEIEREHMDSLTAILMHNSLYKFNIANPNINPKIKDAHLTYKDKGNIPFKAEFHPLAYILMLCDELQCWDRTAYGRNSKQELHPISCRFDFSNNNIKAIYLYDKREVVKIDNFKNDYIAWLQLPNEKKSEFPQPKLKSYSGMFIKENGISNFQNDIERIVDLSDICLTVETGLVENAHANNDRYLSDSNFINLYNFAIILNGRWNSGTWKKIKISAQEEKFLRDNTIFNNFSEAFKNLSLEYKLSNINQAKSFAKYMNEIGCFYTDKPIDFELVEHFTESDLIKIGHLEHQRWLQEHYDMGWEYGTPSKEERDLIRQHKDMLLEEPKSGKVSFEDACKNYERLSLSEQDKDTEPMECMLAMLKMFNGLKIYRL